MTHATTTPRLSFADLLALPRAPSPFIRPVQSRDREGAATYTSPIATSPTAWAASHLNFHPDPLQAEILDAPDPALLLLCTRQFGKTTLTAIKALHFALSHPGTLTIVAAPIERRSGEWIRLVRAYLTVLGIPAKSDPAHRFSVVLPNHSRLIGIPGVVDNNRGYPAHLLIFDEAAFVPAQVYSVLTPSLAASSGALWLISSAGPESGFFYEQWRETRIPWRRFKVTATECPRITPAFLARERLLNGEQSFRQEYLCEFQPGPTQTISRHLLESALDPTYNNSLWLSP
jgi:hypothetical protein